MRGAFTFILGKTRSVKIVDNREQMRLEIADSAMIDFFGMPESDIVHLDGAWARERMITRNPIVGDEQSIGSRYGASSHVHNPFVAICDRSASEKQGDVYGFSLVYSGNFSAGIEMNQYQNGREFPNAGGCFLCKINLGRIRI